MPRSAESSQGTAFARWGQQLSFGFIGLGLLAIAIGWYGSSGAGAKVDGKTDVRAQLPYLLSGGALGLAFVVLGVGLLVVHALRANRDRLEGLLVALADRPDSLVAPLAGEVMAGDLVVAGTASYHDPACRLAPADAPTVPREEAADRGLAPCRVCSAATAPLAS